MTQHNREETRASLLDAAVRRFTMDGYHAASVDEICGEAGVSKGAFYHHFPSKQALFLVLLEGWLKTVDAGLEAIRQPSVPETFMNMTQLLPAILAASDERLPMYLEFWTQASRDEKIWEATIAPFRHYSEYFASLIREGVREGSFQADLDAQAAARVVLSLAVGMFLQGVLDPHGADWQKVAEESMRILTRGLEKQAEGR